jgi:hypothetical protein
LDSITEQDVIETWAVFFTLLEKNESNKKDKKNIYLKVNEIEKILNDLPKKNQYEEDSKKRLIDWHQNYTENNALGPNLSLSSKALRLKMMYQTIQPSL